MAIVDYASLQTAIASRIDRADQATAIQDAIDAATMRLSREFRLFDQEVRASDVADDEYTVLPNDFGGMKTLKIDGKNSEYYSLELFQRYVDRVYTTTKPIYTIVDQQLRIFPAPTETATVALEMVYFQRLAELATDTGTNWVLNDHPDVYLAASMVEIQLHLKDAQAAEMWEGRTKQLAEQAIVASRRRRFPGGSLVIRRI